MPSNRPFFANFFAAFRARSSPTYQAKSSTSPSITLAAATAHISSATSTTAAIISSAPRTITTKTSSDSSSAVANTSHFSTAAATAATSTHRYATPLSRSPGTSSPIGSHTHSHNMSLSPPGTSTPLTRGRQRRGSDSSNSSGGFMDVAGPEKWYIGGRTAGGEERFYRLGLVTGGTGRRVGSADRLSL